MCPHRQLRLLLRAFLVLLKKNQVQYTVNSLPREIGKRNTREIPCVRVCLCVCVRVYIWNLNAKKLKMRK